MALLICSQLRGRIWPCYGKLTTELLHTVRVVLQLINIVEHQCIRVKTEVPGLIQADGVDIRITKMEVRVYVAFDTFLSFQDGGVTTSLSGHGTVRVDVSFHNLL